MSCGLTETISIETNKSLASEWEGQLLKLSMRKRLIQKYSSNEITQIHAKYAPQKEEIKNKIDSLDDKSVTSEYQELLGELRELDNMENDEVKAAEEKASQAEEDIQLEQDALESRLEALKKDTESMEEMRKANVEDSFNYFQT